VITSTVPDAEEQPSEVEIPKLDDAPADEVEPMPDVAVPADSAIELAGSWHAGVDGGHGAHAAGRLYCTSLATMILEVSYRHLLIYGTQSVDEEFHEGRAGGSCRVAEPCQPLIHAWFRHDKNREILPSLAFGISGESPILTPIRCLSPFVE
jgi:hypothetical protein